MNSPWNQLLTRKRLDHEGSVIAEGDKTTGFGLDRSRDWDRIIFSGSFRRMHDKTQVFPLAPHEMVHSRLTHSLEVGSVGRSLGNAVGEHLQTTGVLPEGWVPEEVGHAVAAASLAHDIGNPPFGHSGEESIASFFRGMLDDETTETLGLTNEQKLDLIHFEGNAQGFRLLTRLENEGRGLRLSATTLASFMKYPRTQGPSKKNVAVHPKKAGVLQSEENILKSVASLTGLQQDTSLSEHDLAPLAYHRHPLAYLVEAADDICYRIIDLEDGVHMRLVDAAEAKSLLCDLLGLPKGTPHSVSHLRSKAIALLVQRMKKAFVDNCDDIVGNKMTGTLLDKDAVTKEHLDKIKVEVSNRCYTAEDVLQSEMAGFKIFDTLLGVLVSATYAVRNNMAVRSVRAMGPAHARIRTIGNAESEKILAVCRLRDSVLQATTHYEAILRLTDYVSGMTDSTAVRLYRRVVGTSLPDWE